MPALRRLDPNFILATIWGVIHSHQVHQTRPHNLLLSRLVYLMRKSRLIIPKILLYLMTLMMMSLTQMQDHPVTVDHRYFR
jgi:hypothetical protein